MANGKIAEIAREDAASRSLLAQDPALWFFLNLLMSSIGKTNEHLQQLHDDLGKVIWNLEESNRNTEAMVYRSGGYKED